jgi:valyl-tRNA synthetase
MPFITEEIWQTLPHEGESIMVSPWPDVCWEIDSDALTSMTHVMDTTRAIRNLRAELAIPPSRKIRAIAHAAPRALHALTALAEYVRRLAGLETLELGPEGSRKPAKALTSVVPGVEVYLPFEGLIDIDKETERLAKSLGEVETELERVQKRLQNRGFVDKAPVEVREKEMSRREELGERAAKIRARIEALSR